MTVHKIQTKFDADDIVIGFPDKLPKKLKIDRIDIRFERFDKERPEFTRYETIYLATPVDNKFGAQRSYREDELFTKDSLKAHIDSFLEEL